MEAETNAILDGFTVCLQYQIQVSELEVDSYSLFSMVQDSFNIPWHVAYSIKKCKNLLNIEVKMKHVYREGNKAADRMAAFGHSISILTVFNLLGSLHVDCKKAYIDDRAWL